MQFFAWPAFVQNNEPETGFFDGHQFMRFFGKIEITADDCTTTGISKFSYPNLVFDAARRVIIDSIKCEICGEQLLPYSRR